MKRSREDGRLSWINGPVVKATGMVGGRMLEMVQVGQQGLIGEIIAMEEDLATIQVYENTSGLKPGEPVTKSGALLSVELGPGLLGGIFDGIQRPLDAIFAASGVFIDKGVKTPSLDRQRRWDFQPRLTAGTRVSGGEILGTVAETPLIEHRILVPPGTCGELQNVAAAGSYRVDEPVATVESAGMTTPLSMLQTWQVRKPRPVASRLVPAIPLITGQRVIDIFFPLAKGGTAAIPGGFGTGKTITQHNLAKWCDADIIVYIGCGERGNEMTGVLTEFPQLKDPRSGHSLMERTVLIANTSNMPVAAREASVYTGVTVAEYYRDMGYHVAVMADSTSRWAEALREISGRLEEMPAEEGFPAYLATRLAEFYERAGRVTTLGGGEGSVSIIGAVSPPGGDFSEPMTQHTKRFVRCFWSLDKDLASARFFPAINTMDSYSEYHQAIAPWWQTLCGEDLEPLKKIALESLRDDFRLQQIVRLIGEDALPDDQKMTVLAARLIKEGFLQQDAYDPVDMYALPEKQARLLKAILRFCDMGRVLVRQGIPAYRIRGLKTFQILQRLKSTVSNEDVAAIDAVIEDIEGEMDQIFPRQRWEAALPGAGSDAARDLARELTSTHNREELYAEAKELQIPGRSAMSKEELARKIAENRLQKDRTG